MASIKEQLRLMANRAKCAVNYTEPLRLPELSAQDMADFHNACADGPTYFSSPSIPISIA